MSDLSIDNVVQISVASFNPGVNAYNTSNLSIITGENVADSVQTLVFNGIAASGAFVLRFGTQSTASIAWNATADTIQNDINALTGFENVIVTGLIASKTLTLTQRGNLGPIVLPTIPTNTLQTAGSVAVTITPINVSQGWSGGTLGYALYVSPSQVAKDFGTNSITYAQANAIFSQQPNILAGGGQLIAILRKVSQQTLTFSGIAASGTFELEYNSNTTAPIAWNAAPADIQAALRLLPGLSQVEVTGNISHELVTVIFNGVYGNALPLIIQSNSLMTSAPAAITITVATSVTGETYAQAITRTQGLVSYFGVIPNESNAVLGQTDVLSAAAVILPLNMIGGSVSYAQADIQPGGTIDLLRSGTFTNSRGLYYGDDGTFFGANSAAIMMAAYMGRALSVNFNGSNTTISMNLKQLRGIQPDPTMTQTIYNLAKSSGADLYVSYQGDPSVVSNGANKFFDQVYNLEWLIGALQVAGFNYLAGVATKVPQTEQGMDGLKNAYATVCAQGVTNAYMAPGQWTNAETFGPQDLFYKNISQFGYYLYSLPITQQLADVRAARQAPLVQIAVKESGAIHQSSVIVYVNP